MIWLAVYCNSRQEALANHFLRQLGYQTLFLHYQDAVQHARRAKTVIRSLYPRYIFAALDPSQSLYGITTAQGVHSIVGDREGPLTIPHEIIEQERKRGDENGLCVLTPEEKKVRKRLRKGTKVRFQHGSLTGFLGTVIVDAGSAVKLWVEHKRVSAHPEQLSPVVAER